MLWAYNLTMSPLPLAAGGVTLPPDTTAVPGNRGPGVNVTGKLRYLTNDEFDALQDQFIAKQVEFEWDAFPEYATPGLTVYDEEHRSSSEAASISIPGYTNEERALLVVNPEDRLLIVNKTSHALNHTDNGLWYDALGNLA